MPVNEAIIDEIGSLRVLKASMKGKLGNAPAENFFYSATGVELFCFEEYQDRSQSLIPARHETSAREGARKTPNGAQSLFLLCDSAVKQQSHIQSTRRGTQHF